MHLVWTSSVALVLSILLSGRAGAEEPSTDLSLEAPPEAAAAEPVEGPPLPFHTIEGYGGGAITPMAYLVNPGPEDEVFGVPALAGSYVGLGRKNLQALTITETLFGRVELGYAADRVDLGSLPSDIEDATGVDIETEEAWLHNLNARVLAVKENSFDQPLPAVTVGGHLKFNDGIDDIDDRLGGALASIGYDRDWGLDATLTATKTIPNVFNRPLILSAGVRGSQGANLGFLGFSDEWAATFEGNVAYLPTDWLLIAYEYRQKPDPYDKIPGLIEGENDWHAIDVSLILGRQATLVAGYGRFGTLANADANDAWWLQLKYEF